MWLSRLKSNPWDRESPAKLYDVGFNLKKSRLLNLRPFNPGRVSLGLKGKKNRSGCIEKVPTGAPQPNPGSRQETPQGTHLYRPKVDYLPRVSWHSLSWFRQSFCHAAYWRTPALPNENPGSSRSAHRTARCVLPKHSIALQLRRLQLYFYWSRGGITHHITQYCAKHCKIKTD